jgi:flagellar basal-body rod modification protein FlgD
MTSAVDNFNNVMSQIGVTSSSSSAAAVKDATSLDQSSFLKLMTAQLKNQDPFEPVDNSEMVGQMAQMSTVSGIAEMNSTLTALAGNIAAGSTADAVSLVGKTVLVDGKVAYAATDGSIAAKAVVDEDADDVTFSVTDASGNIVRTIDMGEQAKGTIDLTWDGKDNAGNAVTNGPYTLSAIAKVDNLPTALSTQVWAPVTSVSLSSSGAAPTLQIAGVGEKPLSAVHQVG